MSNIWVYWEGKCPPFIELCWQTILLHNPTARRIGPANISAMGGNDILQEAKGLSPAIRSDLIRCWLLYTYGGIWIDADTICLQPLDWAIDPFDLVCVRNPNTAGIGTRGAAATPWAARKGSVAAGRLLELCRERIERMQAGIHVHYGQTSTGILSAVARQIRNEPTTQIRHHWRYLPVKWNHARQVFLKRGNVQGHETNTAWRVNAVTYHLTNVVPDAYKGMTIEQILADNRFATFLLNKALGNVSVLPPNTWSILEYIPRDRPIVGVEIGVFRANNARHLLQQRTNLTLYLVDPWRDIKDPTYQKTKDYQTKFTCKRWKMIQRYAERNIRFAGPRALPIRETSQYAVKDFKDASVDFVFIDGNHSEEGATRDIELWLPKVKPGGWIGGHDYKHPRAKQRGYGVTQAVNRLNYPILTGKNTTWFVKL
jgi:hypothetical protein